MFHRSRRLRALRLSLLAVVACLILPLVLGGATPSDAPEAVVERAWQLATASGSYRYNASIEQTSYPALALTSSGRAPRVERVGLEGSIDTPNKALELRLWSGVDRSPARAQSLRMVDGRVEQRQGLGSWQPADTQSINGIAPGGNLLSFLSGARDFVLLGSDTRQFDSASGSALNLTLSYRHYRFTLDGPKLADTLSAQIEAQYRASHTIPVGAAVDFGAAYRQMGGQGEVWIDQDGLPRRLTLQLEFPPQGQQGRSSSTLTADYTDFDRARLALASTSLIENPVGWMTFRLENNATALRQLGFNLGVWSILILLLVGWMRQLRDRKVHAFTVGVVIASMVFAQLLTAQSVSVFAAEQQALQATSAQQQQDADRAAAALSAATENTADPHQDPRAAAPALPPVGLTVRPPTALAAPTDITDDTDTDGDGLSDGDEAIWGSCPSATSTAAACEDVADSIDTDGDGLGDGIEVTGLGTLPSTWDSDNDLITDTLEINGFRLNGLTWYLNPNAADTNHDGLIDSLECSPWLPGATDFNPAAACPDTDGDGTPDVWDDDNDNDGVPDAIDLNANTSSPVYTNAQPLALTISDLQPDTPVFVDLQLRPTDVAQLNYIGSVLDWPTGDTAGQIKRRLDTTFASTANPELVSSDANAANGDLRLVPLLEISVPYQSGHYANLPVKAAYQNVVRTPAMRVDEWLDTTELDPYSITVRDADATSGDLVIYVPLSAVADEDTGMRAAFAARMLYWPGQTTSGGVVNWGSAQEYRVVWMVQMITDSCADEGDLSTCADTLTVIHTYREDWRLAGMTVREDHGLAINILYEDPAQESAAEQAADNDLWPAAWNLNNIWLRSRDCEVLIGSTCQGNGVRDVNLATMESRLDSWSGNTDAIEAISRSYLHQGYLSHVMMTDTLSLLDANFSVANEPLLLFASEQTHRTGSLAAATINGGSLGIPMDAANAPEVVQGSLSWARYQYSAAGGWQNYDSVDDLNRLALELADEAYFQPADSSAASQYEADGKTIMTQAYYSALLTSVSGQLELDGASMFVPSIDPNAVEEDYYEAAWPSSITPGATYTAFAVGQMLFGGSFSTIGQRFSNPQTTASFKNLAGFKFGSNGLMVATISATVVGGSLFAAGYFSGDEALQNVGETILSATTVVVSTVWAANMIYGMTTLQKASTVAMRLDDMAGIARANRGVGAAGLVLALSFTWGFFLFNAGQGGYLGSSGSIEFNTALAFAIATTIVALIFFIIDIIPIIGPIIISLIYITDGLITLFCNDCKGIQTLMTEGIATLLYDVDTVVEGFNATDRLDYTFDGITFVDDEAGFTSDQGLTFTMAVTSTIRRHDNVSDAAAKQTTLRYFMQKTAAEHHADIGPGDMKNEWYTVSGPRVQTKTTSTWSGDPVWLADIGAGINRSLEGHLYFTEAYALPYRGCWLAFGINANCNNWESMNGSWSSDVGQHQIFDILPATISEFYNLDWSDDADLRFPANLDHDGDGLTSSTDPDDGTWDADGDELSDYYELTNGLNPRSNDTDGDGLDDGIEVRRGLNPFNGDGDDDGLSDREEWEGWRVAYQVIANTPRYTWVWPDAYSPDGDSDGLTDQEEFFYGFHPAAATDSNAILNTITFADSTISEGNAPLLLLRMEDQAGSQIVADHAGDNRLVACDQPSTCPTAGALGRYGSALSFDGSSDYLAVEQTLSLSTFTEAAWIYPTSTDTGFHTILGYQPSNAWQRAPSLYVFDRTKIHASFGTGSAHVTLTTGSVLNAGDWNHVAATFDGSTYSIYVNGVESASLTTSKVPYPVTRLQIGRSDTYFQGRLDDVAVYDYALSTSQIGALMQGAYNPNDYVVTSGDPIDTDLTLNNNSASWPAAVTYYGQLDASFDGYSETAPYARFKFDESGGADTFANAQSSSTPATCSSCPTSGVPGYRNGAIEMDGDDDIVDLAAAMAAAPASEFTTSTAFGMWIYPTSSANKQQIYVLEHDDISLKPSWSFLEYNGASQSLTVSGRIIGTDTSKDLNSPTNSVPLNQWSHVLVSYDWVSFVGYIYINGALAAHGNMTTMIRLLEPARKLNLGDARATSTYRSFGGTIDDVVIYSDAQITAEDAALIMQEQDPQRPILPPSEVYSVPALSAQGLSSRFTIPAASTSGAYEHTQAAAAALDIDDEYAFTANPLIRAHFDEPGWSSVYASTGSTALTCRDICPSTATDFAGLAAVFAGSNQSLSAPVALTVAPWTVGLWVKPWSADSTNKRAIFGQRNSTSGFPSLFITTNQRLGLGVYTSGGWQEFYPSTATVRVAAWQQITLTYNGSATFKIYVDGLLYGTVTATPSSIPTTMYLGEIGTGYSMFQGRLDNFTLYNAEFTLGQVQALSSLTDLSLHARYTFDDPPGDTTFTDLAGLMGDASCASCPTLGYAGQVGQAALFDGNDLITTNNVPKFWDDTSTSFSLVGWMRVESGKVIESLATKPHFTLWHNRVGVGSGAEIQWLSRSADGYAGANSATWELQPITEWVHIAVVFDAASTNDRLYINGVATSQSWSTYTGGYNTNFPLRIGDELIGYLDDLSLYQRVLDSSEVAALYAHTAPELALQFEESYTAASFADSSVNGYSGTAVGAQSGNLGRVGNGLTLNGASYVELTGATALEESSSSGTTIMAWVNPEQTGGEQTIYATYSGAGRGLRMSITSDGYLRYGNGFTALSTSPVAFGTWSHVAAVLRDQNHVTFYINGSYAGSSFLGSPITTDTDGIVTVGVRRVSSTARTAYYTGEIDELMAYARALTGSEVKATYTTQFRSFRKEHTARLTVDADAPVVSLVSSATHWANADFQLTVATTDTTSGIWAFDYSVRGPDGVDRSGQSAQPCADSVGTNLWCLPIDPATLGGAGAYDFQFRAVDSVGNQTTTASHTIYVDDAGPQVSSSYSGTWLVPAAAADQKLAWSVTLAGAISDPAIALAGGGTIAGAGVDPDSVQVALIDAASNSVSSRTFLATVSGNTWTVDYRILGQRPTGLYTLQVSAADLLGNQTAGANVGTVLFDLQPPSIELDERTLPENSMGPGTLRGTIREPLLPGGAVAAFHFAEGAGATTFAGSARTDLSASCGVPAPVGDCPTTTSGLFGAALQFSAATSTRITVPATTTLDLSAGTLSAWIRPTWTAGSNGYNPAILALRSAGGTRYSWHLRDNYSHLDIYNGATVGAAAVSISPNQWTHVAVVQAGSRWTAYVNGVEVGGADQAFGSATGLPLTIGAATGSLEVFTGAIDEVLIFDRVLDPSEIYKLAQRDIAGLSAVEVWLEPFDFDSPPDRTVENPAADWTAATLAATSSGEASWSYAVPADLEQFYQVNLRGSDLAGNVKAAGSVWRGAIDTRAPRLSVAAAHVGGMLTGHTEYTIIVDELFMDLATLAHPACASTTSNYEYHDNPPLPQRLELLCATATIEADAQEFSICDYSDQCTTVMAAPASVDLSEVAIDHPADNNVVKGSGSLLVSGRGFVSAGAIKQIGLTIAGAEIAQWSYPEAGATAAASWAESWTPPAPGSYLAEVALTDWSGRSFTDTATFLVSDAPLPGGVRDNLALWLDAGEGLAATNGAAVTTWADQAQGWTAQHTSDLTPTLASAAINFNPAVRFGASGISELSFGPNVVTAPAGSSGMTIFAVADPTAATGTRALLDVGSFGGAGYGLALSADTALAYVPAANSGTSGQPIQGAGSAAPALLTYAVTFGSGSSLALNGGALASASNTGLTQLDAGNLAHSASHQAASGPLTLGRRASDPAGTNAFTGDLAEVIIYTGTLSLAERRQVESYLALKYGLTLSDATQPLSYTSAANSAVIWDPAAQGSFVHDVAGIGRDDTSGLDQRMSRSVTSADILTIAHGTPAAPASFSANQSFLLWANNNLSATSLVTTTQGTLSFQRLARSWQVREHGTVGLATLAFDLAAISSTPIKVWLAVSSDPAFSTFTLIPGTVEGGQARFSRDLADGEYVTLAINRRELLTVGVTGTGAGVVSSVPVGLRCTTGDPGECSARFDYRQLVTLTATPNTGSSFSGWSGACGGNGTCVVTADTLGPITATFTLNSYPVNVSLPGTGLGTVSSPAGISCGDGPTDCAETLTYGTVITLTATPHVGSTFAGWSGACSGTNACVLTVGLSNGIDANFSNPAGAPLGGVAWPVPGRVEFERYNTGGEGVSWHDNGNVPATTPSLDTDGTTSLSAVAWGEWVKYTVNVASDGLYRLDVRSANPLNAGYYSVLVDGQPVAENLQAPKTTSWSSYATISTNGIALTAGEHVITFAWHGVGWRTAKLTGNFNWFDLSRIAELTVATAGTGQGRVASSPEYPLAGVIDCGSLAAGGAPTGTCQTFFPLDTLVTLAATPSAGSAFTGWSGGGCAGTGSCAVAMDQAQSVSATFSLNSYPLTVVKNGPASGTVTSDAGIDCGADCAETLLYGSSVILTATPAAGAEFQGWGGACDGSEECVVTIDEINDVTATFNYRHNLSVTVDGAGSGKVATSSGLLCDAECNTLIFQSQVVTLTASPDPGSTFSGWGGACGPGGTPTGACVITVAAATEVSATFTISVYDLEVALEGPPGATVTINPGAITCAADCTTQFSHGSRVSLSVTTPAGIEFSGWGGACSGKQECELEINAPTAVVATLATCAAAFTVTTDADSGPGSLRQSIAAICPEGTIGFAGDYSIDLQTQVTITSGLTIDGGTHAVTVSGALIPLDDIFIQGGIFSIDADGPVALRNLNIVDGTAYTGGAIYATSELSIEDSTFAGNRAEGNSSESRGGAVYSSGLLSVRTSAFSDNNAHAYGGAIYLADGSVATISSTSFDQNAATNRGGGVAVDSAYAAIDGSSFTSNTTGSNGGGLDNTNGIVTITGSTFSQNAGGFGAAVMNQGTTTLSATVLLSNRGWLGGGVLNCGTMDIFATQILSNTAEYGAGVAQECDNGPLTVSTSTLAYNVSGEEGGGLYLTRGDVSIRSSTIAHNSSGYQGGAFNLWAGSLTMDTSTVAHNTSDHGGAFFVERGYIGEQPPAYATITNTTIASNTALEGGGFLIRGDEFDPETGEQIGESGRVQLFNSIVAANAESDCDGTLIVSSNNLIEDATCAAAYTGAALLGELGANGGSTATLALLPDSPAIDVGGTSCGPLDQRGYRRPVGAACDLGAVEFGAGADQQLTVDTVGLGHVVSTPAGIDCGTPLPLIGDCTEIFSYASVITLTATPAVGATFGGWTGACSGSTPSCQVAMDQARAVTATFTLSAQALTVATSGTGSGTVSSSPAGIDCGATCMALFTHASVITLTATPAAGSTFGGWTGACSGSTPSCQVAMDQARAVTATFTGTGRVIFLPLVIR
ncbi:MAG: hypothetical protein H0T53_08900 [Herpetosiphonaceae bacterium]|nr:hypothetical protein [Herpetosiphonaceae bacterium]